ncbi:patatin-like protein [Sphingorhabdus sp.]|uniref:patatin-like protein n=1 Tax=Sphingorhabdus sp. TaxID=1902408 RepID=UPI0035B1D496
MREKELRLALICYGGVSLAVYMHGITREIWHLVRASRAYLEDQPAGGGSEDVYRELLQLIEAKSGTKLRVLTDIIAGASAGGINGVFLSQAVVTGQSLEPLTDLWLQNADVEVLLDPDARPLSRFSKFWAAPIAWAVLRRRGGAVEQTVSSEAQDEVATKLSGFVRARWFQPPFGGTGFSALLLDALQAMKQQGVTRPLLPAGQPLDLFVTVTDFHGHREKLRLNSPSDVSETEHRITIGFSTRGQDPGHLAPPAELVFAARATASFPGAFPPFNVRELDGLLLARSIAWDGRDAFLKRILPQQFEAGTIEDSFLIDGSVLANAPFAQAIGALRNRPARREVDRRFVYIDPKPGLPSFRVRGRNRAVDGPRKAPGFFATIFGASSDIPREQPIRDSLNAIEMRSERIARMREITDHLEVEVEHMIETMLGKTWFLTKPTPQRLHKWRLTMLEKSALATGYSYPAYAHLRMTGLLDEIVATARRVCPDAPTDHCHQLRAALWGEICRRGLDRITGPKGKVMAAASMRFFREQDVRFRIRRLRFIARKLAEDVEVLADVPVAVADRLRQAIYASLAHFLEVETAEYLGVDVAEAVRHGVDNPGALLDMLAARRNLEAADAATDAALNAALANVPDAATRSILMGYLGYILYDIATLPLLQGEGLDEFDPIKVDRISPDDATTIRKGGAAATLKGIEFNNFGAFFSRSYRENDYLWGRLHGIDRLVDIVLSSMPGTLSAEQAEVLALKKKAFEAVLEAEAPRLKRIQPLIEELRAEISTIAP